MNNFLNGLKNATNFTYTENGALCHRSTGSYLYDLFALGGAYRTRSNNDCILLFKKAYEENPVYALKCLFYIGDCRGGQGERRFFRVCLSWLATYDPCAVRRNLEYIPFFRRWDDLFCLFGTPLEDDVLTMIKSQLALDIQSKTPSLLAKWLPSENTSSAATRAFGNKIRTYLGLSHKGYRKMLSAMRERIKVLEKLMSANRWTEIEFDKIPSKAGIKYKNAFARHDLERAKSEKAVQTYADFAKDTTTKVNATVLNPVDIAEKIFSYRYNTPTETDRAIYEKYWQNLKDYYNGREENGIAVIDVSGSMTGQPMNAAISMGAYIAERGKGPFANHFITFSGNPQLVKFEGIDIYDKFMRARGADWGMNTNIEATLNLLLEVALCNNIKQEDMPSTLYLFSDMEFDSCATMGPISVDRWSSQKSIVDKDTLFEVMKKKWANYGYKLPRIIFWNLNSRHENIPAIGEGFSFVSGFSMNMVEQILSGEDGYSLMMKKLNTERYSCVK